MERWSGQGAKVAGVVLEMVCVGGGLPSCCCGGCQATAATRADAVGYTVSAVVVLLLVVTTVASWWGCLWQLWQDCNPQSVPPILPDLSQAHTVTKNVCVPAHGVLRACRDMWDWVSPWPQAVWCLQMLLLHGWTMPPEASRRVIFTNQPGFGVGVGTDRMY